MTVDKNEGRMKSKAILFIVNSLGGGGAERVCANLAAEYSSMGFHIDFITLYDRPSYDLNFKFSHLCLHINEGANQITRACQIIKSINKVNDWINQRELHNGSYALITSHLQMAQLLTRVCSVSRRAIYVMHGAQWPHDPHKSLMHRLYLHAVYDYRSVSCVSQGLKSELVNDYGFNSAMVSVIYNPIPIPKVDMSFEPKVDCPYFCVIGRLNKLKRVDRAIEIMNHPSMERFKLVVIGDGELRKQLESQVAKLQLGNRVVFTGYQTDPYSWMFHSAGLLSTSDSEAFPCTPVEALLLGVPVVLSNCRFGPNEILTNKLSRFLISPIDDLDAYREALCEMALGNYPFVDFDSVKINPSRVCEQYLCLAKNNDGISGHA